MYTLGDIRPVWAEINLDNLTHNIKEIRKNISENSILTAVVKANGYGHGSIKLAKLFLENGADRLAVATLSEAIELRRAHIDSEILILGYTQLSEYSKVIENNLTQTIYTLEQGEELNKLSKDKGITSKVHIKIDSGMSRLGFQCVENSVKDIKIIYNLSNLQVEGIYSHFARADEIDMTTTDQQFEKFMGIVNDLEAEGVNIPIKHISNSASIIQCKEYNLDMVRPGIILYGLYPSEEVSKDIQLKPAMTLKTRISHIKEVEENVGISYGHAYRTKSKEIIGTLPLGYADCFLIRYLSM